MKKKIDNDMPIGKLTLIKNFLPSPEVLFSDVPEKKVRVNMYLSKSSVGYIKTQAKMHNTNYQKVIRDILDIYVTNSIESNQRHGKAA